MQNPLSLFTVKSVNFDFTDFWLTEILMIGLNLKGISDWLRKLEGDVDKKGCIKAL